MTHHPVQVGFAGVASEWLDGLPTLVRQRMRVSAVFDPTPAAAVLAAEKLGGTHVRSFQQLVASPLVDAVIVANPGWMAWHAPLLAMKQGLPVLLVVSRLDDAAFFDSHLPDQIRLESALSYARANNGFLMPGLPMRWQPVTIRVRELTATSLGAVEMLHITTDPLPLKSRRLAELVDWGLSLVQTAPDAIHVQSVDSSFDVVVRCRRRRVDGGPVEIRIRGVRDAVADQEVPTMQAVGYCRHGEFSLVAPTKISHSIDRHVTHESLVADRSAFDVMLDLFGRRLVGGVVPVPDFADVLRARNLVLAALLSREHREAVSVCDDGRSA